MPDFSMPPLKSSSALSSVRTNHVCFRVSDYDASKRWYMEKLDFRLVIEWPFADMSLGYFAAPNDDTCIIELIGGGTQPPANPPTVTDLGESLKWAGCHHVCFYVDSVDATVAILKQKGVPMVGDPFVLDDIGRRLAFFADPFGNLFELAEVVS
jgi:catechol 2,3-dioxygenase-like lactoylglutathione lyase family enzyme